MAEWHTNIDLIFRDGLKDYELLPPDDVWDNVKKSIPGRKRRIYSALSRAAAAAIIIASAGTVTYLVHTGLSDTFGKGPAITFNQDAMPEEYYKTPLEKSNAPSLQPLIVEAKTKSISGENQQFDPENFSRYEINQVETTETNISTLPAATFSLAEPKFYQASGIKGNRIYEINKDITERENSSTEKWKIGATLLPSYYSRFSFSQHNAGKEYIKSEKPVFSYSGGFSFSYELSRRISLSSGITYSSIGQRIDDISSYTGFLKYTDTKSSSDFSIMTASGTINSTNKDIFLLDKGNVTRIFTRYTADVFDPVKASLSHLSNSIIQDMNYIEIPFVLKYKLIDRNVDINMLGGLFYSILVGNSSYISSDGIRYIIGKTDGLSPVTLSSSVGVGMEYRLSEQITFNIEPLLRYYITPLGGLPGSIIHPYSFGILSGVFYKF